MRHSLETLNDFNTLALKQIFWESETFFKKLKYCVLVEITKIASFPKLPYQKLKLKQIEW